MTTNNVREINEKRLNNIVKLTKRTFDLLINKADSNIITIPKGTDTNFADVKNALILNKIKEKLGL